MAGSPSRQKFSKWPVFKGVGAGERFHGLNGRSWNEGGLIALMGQLRSETTQAVTGASVIVTQHPDPQRVALNVIQEMIGKPVQIATSQAAGIKVIEARIRAGLLNPELKLDEKIVSQIIGDGIILA